jgi:hypothetical protein
MGNVFPVMAGMVIPVLSHFRKIAIIDFGFLNDPGPLYFSTACPCENDNK